MRVRNVHERVVQAAPSRLGELLDSLASEHDSLWPRDRWPPMRFDRGLAVGAIGGHGPIRYTVDAYEPGRSVRFRFTGPRGFDGHHGYEVEEAGPGESRIRHVVEMKTRGRAMLAWPLVYRPLHDALMEDSLDRVQAHCGGMPEARRWSIWVRLLRWALGRARGRQRSTRSGPSGQGSSGGSG